jgi:cation diffusion facilitator family transporter
VHEGSRKAILAAFFANLGIAIAKFVGFLITQSASLLAEAIHSVADSANQLLLMLGGNRARKTATPTHPFGYGRERYFWAFVVALVLFSMGGLFALYEGIEKLRHPHAVESLPVAVTILVVAMILEAFSLRTAVLESRKVKPPRASWRQFIHRTKQPELPVVLLEDIGAMVGLVLALTGVVLSAVTDNPRFDAMGSVTIGVLLILIAAVLAWEMKGLLIGEAATPEMEDRITDAIAASPHVVRLIHMRTEHLGPDELLVGVKVELSSGLTVTELADAINEAEARVRQAVPEARIMYLEPDVYREVPAEVSSPTHQGSSEDTPG